MIRKNQKICNNYPAHLNNVQLQNLRVEFLPPNATSKLQPLDQGIIKVLKQYYCKRLVLETINLLHPCMAAALHASYDVSADVN